MQNLANAKYDLRSLSNFQNRLDNPLLEIIGIILYPFVANLIDCVQSFCYLRKKIAVWDNSVTLAFVGPSRLGRLMNGRSSKAKGVGERIKLRST